MKDLFPIIASIFLLTNSLFAQDERKIDSLQYEIKKFELHKMELGGNKITLMDSTKANILYLICEEYWMNNLEKGMDYSRQLLKLSEQIGFNNGIANACNSMGIIYFYKGDYPQALENHKKAPEISEEAEYKQAFKNT